MFRAMLQFIFRNSIIYYTSYIRMVYMVCMVLIKIYKWVDKMPLNVLNFEHRKQY
jgi:hypothetical protein